MFKVEFETDNAAFDDDMKGEISHILREIADGIEGGNNATIRDINGNEIGKYELTED